MSSFDSEQFFSTAREALSGSSVYIRNAILGNTDLSQYLIKGDRTAVTIIDKGSQNIAVPRIVNGLGDLGIRAEESKGLFGNPKSDIVIMLDPLDGTGGFLIGGPTPTVIMAAYDRKERKVLAAATMEPTTGRFWYSSKGEGAWMNRFDYSDGKFKYEKFGEKISVNKTNLSSDKGSHVLVDVTHPFKRPMPNGSLRSVFNREQRRLLTDGIEEAGAKECSFYTNGGHYALVATGRPSLVGCITTAVGGPFDIAGIRHVIEAGGVAQCYSIWTNEGLRGIYSLGEDIETADIAIAANNKENFNRLEEVVQRAISC